MSAINTFYSRITDIMAEVFTKESEAIEKAAVVLADANKNKHSIFSFKLQNI